MTKLLSCLSCVWLTSAVLAQNSTPHTIFQYRGADRDARLVQRAKEEGRILLYTSLAPAATQPLTAAFEKKYGIQVALWRARSEQVVQRTVTEARARRHEVDVIEIGGPEMEMLAREQLLAGFYSPHSADLPAEAIPAHRTWFPDLLTFYLVAYNTTKVQRSEIPATYAGFADPKWRGRIAVEATDAKWMAALITSGAGTGLDFFRALSAMGPEVRQGHASLATLVAAGDVPVGLTAYQSNVLALKRTGAPIDFVPVHPVVAGHQGLGIARDAPHPHAALLFADYLLSLEGQTLFASLGYVPASTRVTSTLRNLPFIMIDSGAVLDEKAKWEQLWPDLFLTR
jgi:iron(III) transport system substrate-binding protein